MTPSAAAALLRRQADAILAAGEPVALRLEIRSLDQKPPPLSSGERSARQRARERLENGTAPVAVSPTPPSSQTDGSDRKEAEKKPEERKDLSEETARVPARVREAGRDAPSAPSVPPASHGRPLIPCTRGISAILEKSGVVARLAERHQVDPWDVKAALDEFEDYWTSDEREGDPRRLRATWLGDAQRRVADRARMGFLRGCGKAPGLEEHAARSGRTPREAEVPQPKKPDPWAWQWAPGGPLFGQPRPTSGPEADPNRRSNGQRQHR